MLYIHRADFSKNNPHHLPLSYDYMGSSEFEQGGVGHVLKYLTEHSDILRVQHQQFKVKGSVFLPPSERWQTLDLWAVGTQEEIDQVFERLSNHYNSKTGGRTSKEVIQFGYGTGDNQQPFEHQHGFEINNHVFLSVYGDFARFIREYAVSGIFNQSISKPSNYTIGDPVAYYDFDKQRLDYNATISGIPETENEVTVKTFKKKKRVDARFVVPKVY